MHLQSWNLRNRDCSTSLHTAAFFGRIGIVKLLLKSGADVTARDRFGNTPLEATSRPWDQVAGVYRAFESALQLEFDYHKIKAVRSKIPDLIREYGG